VIRCEMDCNTEVPLAFCGAMHNRMKEAAVLLGRQKRAVVRPPLMKRGADGLDLAAVGGMAA
jgi:dihydrodipicolinate synthase/N-acetylneuraminate lyase